MTPFEALRGDMDAGVNNHLGDSISIVFRDGTTGTRIGFLSLSSEDPGTGGFDPIRQQHHLTIDRTQLPEGPAQVARLTHSSLGGWFKMGPGVDADDGISFSRDLQKAKYP